MSPVDIITNAIRSADGNHTMGAGQLADVAVAALNDERIVDHAVAALRADQRENGDDSALGSAVLPDQFLADITRVVLGSIGGAL